MEVYLESQWYLVDPTFRWLFSGYNPNSACLPHGEYFFKRGRDFWDMGIKNIKDFNKALENFSQDYQGDYADPGYVREPL